MMPLLTETEIKTQADAVARDVIDLLHQRAGALPRMVALSIPLGVAATLFTVFGRSREDVVAALNQAFDDIEEAVK